MYNYSGTKCLINGCNSTSFEFVEERPSNCDSGTVMFLRCSSCKRIINFAPKGDPNIGIDKIIAMIRAIK